MYEFDETNIDFPDLDYVDRCIAYLRELESSPYQNGNGEITAAITICEAYKRLLPEFESSIEYGSMPEQD